MPGARAREFLQRAPLELRAEVHFPADFLVIFAMSSQIFCSGAPIHFRVWDRRVLSEGSHLQFLTRFGIEGRPALAWEEGAERQILHNLGAQLVELLPSEDKRCLRVWAWADNPGRLPKEFSVSIPEQDVPVHALPAATQPGPCRTISSFTLRACLDVKGA